MTDVQRPIAGLVSGHETTRGHDTPRVVARCLVAASTIACLGSAASAAQAQAAPRSTPAGSARWAPIRRVFGQEGEAEHGTFRINLPRSDLQVRIGGDTLSPDFEFTSYVGFVPLGQSDVLAMGEVVLRDDEVPRALTEAHRQGVHVTALHNHLIGEAPRIMYMHLVGTGAPEVIAAKLRAIFGATATPLRPRDEHETASADWSAIDAVLGHHAEAKGTVAEYVFAREGPLGVRGTPVRSLGTLETASEAVFQQLGDGRVASTGELFILPSEAEAVARTLEAHGLHVTALHNPMLDETPTMYWIHWYATGDGPTMARGVAAALAHMHSVRTSAHDGGSE